MTDWLVVIQRKGDPEKKRIFVENVEYADDARQLATLKLGVSPWDHHVFIVPIDERVSPEEPNYNPKELYDQALLDLTHYQRECHEAQTLATSNQRRYERVARDRDRLKELTTLIQSKLIYLKMTISELDAIFETTTKEE